MSGRQKLLSTLPKSYEDISPLTVKELKSAHIARQQEVKKIEEMFTPKSKRKRVNNENPQPIKVSGVILLWGGGGEGEEKMFAPKSKRKRVNNENPQPSKVSGVILVSRGWEGEEKMFTPKSKRKRVNNENPHLVRLVG